MEYLIHGREPAAVFRFFEEICAIPHPSDHEERIADYLVAFAEARGLDYSRDEVNNVLIRKPATAGKETAAPLLLQGHTDMVCEKNGDVVHNFMKDPLRLFLDGDLLGAVGTTLGGDDGIAVAVMLAILDGALTEHPALECLFTVSEEVGLNGAHRFDYSKIGARRMINLDSEALGVVTAGCAGGLRTDLTFKTEPIPFSGDCVSVTVKGLAGGHSGADINTGRANANKLMGRLLASLAKTVRFRLVSLQGGSKDNAIPRECCAVMATADAQAAIGCLTGEAERIREELVDADSDFCICAEILPSPKRMLSEADTAHVVAVLACAANGVLAMSRDVTGLVEWSRNLGVIETAEDGGTITFVFSSRSATESRLDASARELDALAAVTGCTARHYSRYPGWQYAPRSEVRDAYLKAYREVTGQDATIDVIHAGLECGIIYSKLPEMDMISIGPNLYDIHSPNERLDLASVEVFWKTLETVLRHLC